MSELNKTNPSFAGIESEVISWYKSYAQPWYEGNPSIDKSMSFYAVPNYFCLPDGIILLPDTETQRSFFVKFSSDLKSKGWTTTRLLNIHVKVLNSRAAFISTEVVNEDAEGSPIEGDGEATYSYLVGKTVEGWKFLSCHTS